MKRYLALILILGAVLMVGGVYAQTSPTLPTMPTSPTSPTAPTAPTMLSLPSWWPFSRGNNNATTSMPVIVNINANGNALLRGVISSISGTSSTSSVSTRVASSTMGSLVVNSWGGEWIIRTGTNGNAQVLPASTSTSTSTSTNNITTPFSHLKVGDFVGVTGVIATDQDWTIDASLVRDWTLSGTTFSTTTTRATLFVGTVSNMGTNSFTLIDAGGNTYVVNIDSSTTLWNTARSNISSSSILSGHTVRVEGMMTDSDTITATIVRDISI